MHSTSFYCSNIDDFRQQTSGLDTPSLIQIYGHIPIAEAQVWADELSNSFANACRIGMASERHLCNGKICRTGVTVIFSYFQQSLIQHHGAPYLAAQAKQSGQQLLTPFVANDRLRIADSAMIVLLETEHTICDDFFDVTQEYNLSIAGGRAGYSDHKNSWVLYQDKVHQEYSVCVAIGNNDKPQLRDAFVDSVTIGRRMLVTSSEGNRLNTIDNLPALQIYKKYLANGGDISSEVIKRFALKSFENGIEINAIPLECYSDQSIQMSDQLRQGSYVKFIYFHPAQSLHKVIPHIKQLNDTSPESILVFNCLGREQFELENPQDKLALLNQVSPISGPYCFGEFFTNEYGTQVLQYALTYVALAEQCSSNNRLPKTLQLPSESLSLTPLFNLLNNSFRDMDQEADQLPLGYENKAKSDWLHDLQTGLLNRFSLLRQLHGPDKVAHLAVIRIRNFRLINEQYGYSAADNLLVQMANYLDGFLTTNSIGIEFTCYRLSANEVAISINSNIAPRKVVRLFRDICEDIESQEFQASNRVEDLLVVSLSVGIASTFGQKGESICKHKHLLIKASEARRYGQINNHSIYWNGDLPPKDNLDQNLGWIKTVRQALELKQVVPYFQPCYDSQTGKEIGAEALMRVCIDDKVITPFHFLDLIKQTQLYPKITQAILAHCEQILQSYPNARIAINLSVLDFKHYATMRVLRKFFRYNQVKDRLTLEITETESIQDYEWISPILQEFRDAGALLAIDDFGAGYSNLEKLIALQPDILKLDGSIIKTIDQDEKLHKLVHNINNLAHSLGIKTQAEFVHNKAVMDILVDMKVDYLQGYYLSEPISAQDWRQSLSTQSN
ncbi:bifunctional diguanylate cyclase/phosphodiesterase [Marinomonas epiphytica]